MSQQSPRSHEIKDQLRRSYLFASLPEEQLDQLVHAAEVTALAPSQILMSESDPSSCAYLILDGELEVFRRSGNADVALATRTSGDIVGEMGLITDDRRNATIRANTAATVLPIDRETFQTILSTHPTAMQGMLTTVMQRLQSAEAHLVHHQKMAALGTLAAGLAHELNNPASAIARSVDQLRNAVIDWEARASTPGIAGLDLSDDGMLSSLRQEVFARAADAPRLSPIARSDREREIDQWLVVHQTNEPWALASRLVDAGWDLDSLNRLAEIVTDEDLSDTLWWLALGQTVHLMIQDLATSARVISDIVGATKAYARLDQAPIQDLDVHEGLEQTLTILRHKLRSIDIQRDYSGDLPHITTYASELNQVWTNLIDNAAGALDGQGSIMLRTTRERESIVVEICDTGPGIPPEVQHRLFEPFFTTKPPGDGSGLGLSITYNIVRKHQGDIRFASEPGKTCFQVRLPVRSTSPTGGES